MLHSPHADHDSVFGQELILDLSGCNLKIISSKKKIEEFVITLCDKVIKMKRYGKPLIPHFGHKNPVTSGYSLVQLIETSSVTAHFSEYKKTVYLNIFSCANFDAKKTAVFCKKFFGATHMKSRLLVRT
jgi:S-adenosylmethionine decarboxylase